ncbi:MAG: hypothetical protein KBT05_09195, partial [Bacteroidales bacterium]|nr:hypothetical protein [Candidatus Cryptobacteroides caccocaballi]
MKRIILYLTTAAMVVGGMSVASCSDPFDPSYLEQQIKDLQSRVQTLENSLKDVNTSISSLQTIVNAINGKAFVVSIDQTENGFTVTFSDGKTTTIKTGSSSSDIPQIGVKEADGILYWTVNGDFLLGPDGNKVPATGKDGEDGQDAVAPVIGVKEIGGTLYWTVNGDFLLDADGNKVAASYPEPQNPGSGDSVFKSVKVEDGVVTIELQDGTSFVIPMRLAADLRIEANKLHFELAESKAIHIALTNIIGVTVTEKPDGWKASVDGCTVNVTAPSSYSQDSEGKVVLLATSGDQTFIGKIQVTLEAPLFDMVLAPTGKMTLVQLDTDFNSPGFLAGFVKADEFDPAKIIEPAKDYAPGNEDIYRSWNPVTEGNAYEMDIKSVLNPVVGERYAAYCYPGAYSKWIGTNPDPSDVYVQYFTYIEEDFSLTNVGVDKATVKASFRGAGSFYGGIMRYYDDSELMDLRREFLIDASAPLNGVGDGMYGVLMTSYSGALNMFAAMDDGEGKKNARSIVPGAKYALAFIPTDEERVYGEYTVNDVIIKP